MPRQKIIGILGGGKWGTSLGQKLSSCCQVKLYSKDLKSSQKKVGKLSYFQEIGKLKGSDLIIIAVPSFAIRPVINQFKPFYSGQKVLGVAKGMEKESGLLSSQIVQEVWPKVKYAHLSGPSFAAEVSQGLPVTVSLAMADFSHKKYFQEIIDLKDFKIQLSEDLIGVQLAGVLKNVVAIAAGMSDELKQGENFRAMLILAGLGEMILLGKKLGAKEKTFYGPAGLGDLILTTTSHQSRNHRLGTTLIKNSHQKIIKKIIEGDTFEGASTAYAACHLAKRFKMKLPIIEGVYKVIYESEDPQMVLKEIKENAIFS